MRRRLRGPSSPPAFIALVLIANFGFGLSDITLSAQDLMLKLGEESKVQLNITEINYKDDKLNFYVQHDDIVSIEPDSVKMVDGFYELVVKGTSPGHSEITTNTTKTNYDTDSLFLRVTVFKHAQLDVFSEIIGWIYFVAWSISFYPQIYINYERQSVVGLNFDFLALNVVGFTLYAIFNLGLYFIPEIRAKYAELHPRGLNPVQVNDIVFALHATFACLVTLVQCYRYERADQKVSLTARSILGAFAVFLGIGIILAATNTIHWIDFLYYCSYVKLTITLIKYVPQAYMNYKRKSTVGWSIGNIFLDFTGGILSMLQMIVNSYNYDDWESIFGDKTKFGLGLFSVVFDIFFIVQHYILYRHTNYEES